MKRTFLLSLSFLLFSSILFSQNYEVKQSKGLDFDLETVDKFFIISGSPVSLGNVASNNRRIPFDFEFYGKKYNKCRVTALGYLTFDTNFQFISPRNEKLPSKSASPNTIFGLHSGSNYFFNEIQAGLLSVGSISEFTVGTRPNRKHCYMWRDIINGGQNTSFIICLKESGGFDIVHLGQAQPNGRGYVVGCQNKSRDKGVNVGNSPNYVLPNFGYDSFFSDEEILVYSFNYKNSINQDQVNTNAGTIEDEQDSDDGFNGDLQVLKPRRNEQVGSRFKLKVKAPASYRHVTVYIDNRYEGTISSNSSNYELQLSGLSNGRHSLWVYGRKGSGANTTWDQGHRYDFFVGNGKFDELDLTSKINLYPNPFTNSFKLNLGANHKVNTIKMFDLAGKEILNQDVLKSNSEIDVDLSAKRIAKGFYLLKVIGAQETRTIKVIKE